MLFDVDLMYDFVAYKCILIIYFKQLVRGISVHHKVWSFPSSTATLSLGFAVWQSRINVKSLEG